jgi:simple sugar transport system permease protein
LNLELLIPLLAAAIQSGTPILYATLGEILTEKSGVLNLGVEGMMITGALAAFVTALATGQPTLAFLAGGLTGAVVGGIHAVVCLWFLGNQVVSGLALTIFGLGLANYLGTPLIGQTAAGFDKLAVPLLHRLPGIGPILFQQDILVYVAIGLVPVLWFFLDKTRWGLHLRAAGEHPEAAAAAGIGVLRYRWFGILGGGCLVGFGGSYLSLAYTHLWTNGLTAGRGWIAVALVIFAFWRPGRALIGAYLFGGVMAFQLRLQAVGTHLPSSLLLMLPYLLTVVVLVFSSWKSIQNAAPAALGVNMEPND